MNLVLDVAIGIPVIEDYWGVSDHMLSKYFLILYYTNKLSNHYFNHMKCSNICSKHTGQPETKCATELRPPYRVGEIQ